ncbi:MAG: response regulator transcription factor [Saprospiraceae bacterium]|nr:response regulator transcription factor [Saprospiraceae bacterium]MCB9323465.1 response regulator transcription factor [Lewinellaceae bacterium]
MKAIIIDDNPKAIISLQQDLADYCPEVEIIGTAEGVVSGVKLLKTSPPDVLFLDIQLQDGSGFDVLEILPEINFGVIFTTSSDAFAIKAFRLAAIDYLLKPIDPEQLQEAVQRAQVFSGNRKESLEMIKGSMQQGTLPQHIALHTQDKIQLIKIDEIIRCEANGNYTTFYFEQGNSLLVTKTLKEFDQTLTPQHFLRVHQSHLINSRKIKAFVKTDGGYIVMQDGAKISVSVRKRTAVMRFLEGI